MVFLIQRGLSFVTIMALGLLPVATVILNSVLVAFGSELLNFLHLYDQSFTSNTLQLANNVLIIVVSIVIFYIFFKILPDANVPRKAALSGAVFTAILFFIAKRNWNLYREFTLFSNIWFCSIFCILIIMDLLCSNYYFYWCEIHKSLRRAERLSYYSFKSKSQSICESWIGRCCSCCGCK